MSRADLTSQPILKLDEYMYMNELSEKNLKRRGPFRDSRSSFKRNEAAVATHRPLQTNQAMTQKKLILLIALALAVGAMMILTAGCKRAEPKAPAPPAVTVAPVEQQEVVEWSEFTGRTEPVESVEIRPRVSGYIQEVRFQSGQLVKKGDVLFVIDPRWHQADFARLQADAERAKVQLENAQREANRTERLLTNKAISTEEADARVARYNEAKAALLSSEAARDFAKLDLDYTQVSSPIDGRVSRALLTVGNYVSGVSGASTILTTVVSVNPVYVYADVDEDNLLRFNNLAHDNKLETNGDGKIPVELQLGDEAGFEHKGFIESFDNRLDQNTGSILLRAVFPNDDGRIVPGLFARIRVPLSDRHPAMLVTEKAIATDQAQKYVLTLTSSNTVVYQSVTLGPEIEGKRVIRSGLQPGEKIVVNGLQRVRPGMSVTPQSEVASNEARVKVAKN
jgi:RND family efflux transporter MFP subunit